MKSVKIAIYAALVVFVGLAPMRTVRAQASGEVAAAITKLENDGVKSDLTGDQTWAEKYLADDWVACESNGKWYNKADILRMQTDTKNNKYNSEKMSALKIRVYGNTAIATYKDTYDALVEGEHRARSILVTDVWVKIGPDWKQVSSQGTTTK
jgi:hypothetical protein